MPTHEVDAMTAITNILAALPDDAARQRVMRWSFGRFNPDFHRYAPALPTSRPLVSALPAASPVATTGSTPPPKRELCRPQAADVDFGEQFAEIECMLPARRSEIDALFDRP